MASTEVSRVVGADARTVFQALTSAAAITAWRFPHGMSAVVHEFDARPGGRSRVSLTYADPAAVGKTEANTDTYSGEFVELAADEKVVERITFDSADPNLRRPMTMTTTLTPAGTGTRVTIRHDDLPDGVAPADNEAGTRMALENLAAHVESLPGRGPAGD
ncbi:SRPBCC domain-containing protein [Actinokineospora sp. G85]|uniref:SRPBCC domain-containing protein n=1 Tax=Actinokineospora sp. G85 TaxID=3406626 RepID=UPI003C72DA53